MREETRAMRLFLKNHRLNINATYIRKGTLKGHWRLLDSKDIFKSIMRNDPIREKLSELGFVDTYGRELQRFSGQFVKFNGTIN